MHTASEIIALARQAQVPFGAHAFVVVQENGGFFAEASYLVNPHMTAEEARRDAADFAAYRKSRQPSWDFHVLEVGAPVRLFIKVEGGNVQDVICDRDLPGVEVTVIDFDVTDEDQAVVEVHLEGDRWEQARADTYPITIEPAPITREIVEEGAE